MRTHQLAAASLSLTLAAAALANPFTWYSNAGQIPSRGLLGDANNAVISLPMPALPVGAGNTWQHLTISGNLTSVASTTFASEACIEVTLPGNTRFVIKPFESGSFSGTIAIPAGSDIASPYPMFGGSGTCTLRFFELYADSASGPDAAWSNLTLTLHDTLGNDPFPYSAMINTSAADPDLDTDGNWFVKGQQVAGQFDFNTDRVVDSFRVKGYGTAMCGWNVSGSSSPLSFAQYNITADRADGNGTVSWTFKPFEQFAASTSEFDVTTATPFPVLTGPNHPWHYTLAETGAPAVADNTKIGAIWLGVQPLGPHAPVTVTDLGVIRGNPALGPAETTAVESRTFSTVAHEVKWFTFTTEHACSNATGYWLDVHTRTVAGSPILDQQLGMYSPTGHRLASDDDGGSYLQSMLTFGAGTPVRAPIDPAGGPQPRDGADGELPAGLHYLAVPQFYTQFADTGWYMNVQGSLVGNMAFDIRTNLPPTACGPSDLGSSGGQQGSDGLLNNNDFIAFIDLFFAQNPLADMGSAGGLAPGDGHFDNNDFIVFIDRFFAGCV